MATKKKIYDKLAEFKRKRAKKKETAENVLKRTGGLTRKTKEKPLPKVKPYPMHVLRELSKFEREVITPYQNKLQLSLSTKLKEANSNKMLSWDKLKAITLASAENVASKPTQLSMSGVEALADAENDRLTIYKNGLASKSYKRVFGDIFKAIG